MRIFNHNIELNFRAKRDWNDFRLFKPRNYYDGYQVVWGRIYFSIDQSHIEEIQVHKYCGGLIHYKTAGDEHFPFCEECEMFAETETEYMTVEEWENL